MREGLRRILHTDDGFDIVGECSDGDEVEKPWPRVRPDLVVLDIRMKRVDGVEATRRLRAHADAPPILVLTTFDDDDVLAGALRAGASGFQLKDAPGEDLVRAAARGRRRRGLARPVGDGTGARTCIERTPTQTPPPGSIATLTDREVDVLREIGQGATNQEIASTCSSARRR